MKVAIIRTGMCFAIVLSLLILDLFAQRKGNDVAKTTGTPSPLVLAIQSNNAAEFDRLLSSGDVNIDALHYDYQSPLMIAAEYEKSEFVTKLLKAGADVNKPNSRNKTALHFAVQRGNGIIVRMLVEAKADVNTKDGTFGFSPLMWAAREGKVEIIDMLINAGADLHEKDAGGRNVLLHAAEGGKPEAIRRFLGLGFTANDLVESDGRTALIAASRSPESLKILIASGAKVNTLTKFLHFTALYVAAQNGYTESVKVLIDNGADVNLTDADGRSPLNRAIVGKHQEVIDLLKKAGAK